MEDRFLENMKIVEQSIREAGYVPYDQLYGNVQTGNSLYITRKNNARQIILPLIHGSTGRVSTGLCRRFILLTEVS